MDLESGWKTAHSSDNEGTTAVVWKLLDLGSESLRRLMDESNRTNSVSVYGVSLRLSRTDCRCSAGTLVD